jgi:hypothetical protein
VEHSKRQTNCFRFAVRIVKKVRVAKACLKTIHFKATKRKWNEFLNIIDLAQIEKETLHEQQKKKALDEFLMERNVMRSKEKLHQFV